MAPESEHCLSIAEALIAVPRYLSRDKIRLLGVGGVASIVALVMADPDAHTQSLADEPGGLTCAVCKKLKHSIYFGSDQKAADVLYRICRYCRWRIKTKADEEYRSLKRLPPKHESVPHEEVSTLLPEQIAALDHFLHDCSMNPPAISESRIQLPENTFCLSGYYGPGFANLSSGWYSTTEEEPYGPERLQILAWWTLPHDAVIEWFLRAYGMFALASARGIELEIQRLRGMRGPIARYFEYFVLDRIRTQTHLWNIYASDFLSRYRQTHVCRACGRNEPLLSIHPEHLQATHGLVLPLCNLHWKTYCRAAGTGDLADRIGVPSDFVLDSVLGTHRCPVCSGEHTWMDKTYTYAKGFYSIPPRHREICFNCMNVAINKQPRSYPTKKDLDGILRISQILQEFPACDPYKVITEQARTLDAASAIVRLMKEMVRFESLKKKHGSWFAVLARSGCLPDGSRKEVFGTRILAIDGHECLSMAEKQIDDELHRLRIPHRKEVRYPNALFVCDWVVQQRDGLVFIEYLGLSGQAAYDKKTVQKRAALAQAGLELIELYYEDLQRLTERIGYLAPTGQTREEKNQL